MTVIDQKFLLEYMECMLARPLMYANSAQWLEGQFCQLLGFLDALKYDNQIVPDCLTEKYSEFVNNVLFDNQKPRSVVCFAADHFNDINLLAQFLRRFVELENGLTFPKKGLK